MGNILYIGGPLIMAIGVMAFVQSVFGIPVLDMTINAVATLALIAGGGFLVYKIALG